MNLLPFSEAPGSETRACLPPGQCLLLQEAARYVGDICPVVKHLIFYLLIALPETDSCLSSSLSHCCLWQDPLGRSRCFLASFSESPGWPNRQLQAVPCGQAVMVPAGGCLCLASWGFKAAQVPCLPPPLCPQPSCVLSTMAAISPSDSHSPVRQEPPS